MANYLIVGAAGGVGGAIIRKLKASGHKLAATVLDAAQRTDVAAILGDGAPIFELDLSDPQACLPRLKEAAESLGASLDGAVMAAAIAPLGPVETTPLALFTRTFEINVGASVALFQAAMPKLRESKGRLVFISSMSGVAAMPFVGAYAASKFALEGVADAMRREITPQGVRISLIEPGGIRTGMVDDQLRANQKRIDSLSAEENALYGHLYRGFQVAASASHESTASTPEQVADVVMQALTDAQPLTRYIAGEDAKQLLGLAKSMSDEQVDGVFAQMFGG